MHADEPLIGADVPSRYPALLISSEPVPLVICRPEAAAQPALRILREVVLVLLVVLLKDRRRTLYSQYSQYTLKDELREQQPHMNQVAALEILAFCTDFYGVYSQRNCGM